MSGVSAVRSQSNPSSTDRSSNYPMLQTSFSQFMEYDGMWIQSILTGSPLADLNETFVRYQGALIGTLLDRLINATTSQIQGGTPGKYLTSLIQEFITLQGNLIKAVLASDSQQTTQIVGQLANNALYIGNLLSTTGNNNVTVQEAQGILSGIVANTVLAVQNAMKVPTSADPSSSYKAYIAYLAMNNIAAFSLADYVYRTVFGGQPVSYSVDPQNIGSNVPSNITLAALRSASANSQPAPSA